MNLASALRVRSARRAAYCTCPIRAQAGGRARIGGRTRVADARVGAHPYDANGNLRYEKLPNNSVVKEYRWDQQNRLTSVIEGTHESRYEYDGESRRVRIKELVSSTETKNEVFLWCGSRICQKRASNGSTVLRSYFGQGFEESATTDYFYTRDHLGSVREVVGSNGSTVAARMSFDPWGNVTETGSGAKSDFAFTGHFVDRPTGLSMPKYRGYDPTLGRWLSRDPIHLAGGSNLYGYVGNNTPNFYDPEGDVAAAAAAGIAEAAGAALAIWGAVDCAINGCKGIKKLMDELLGPPSSCNATPKEKAESQSCTELCEPYMKAGAAYKNRHSLVIKNDHFGNARHAVYECLLERGDGS